MRKVILSLAAASMVAPAFVIPVDSAEARHRHYKEWRGKDGRWYCRRPDGTTGLIVGGVVGALVGRELDGGRDRTTGTIIGAGAGALLGREVDRGRRRCR